MKLERLGDHVEILSGFAFKSNLFNDVGEGSPVIRIRDVVRGFSDTFYSGDFDGKYVVQAGDYLIGMDGEFNLGRWRSEPALLNQRVCKIAAVSRELDVHYLGRFLQPALKKIEDTTPFVTVKHLSVKKLNEIEIPLPPLSEQKRIAKILDAADALRAKRRESLAQLDALLQSTFLEMFGDPVENPKGWRSISLGQLGRWQSGGTPPRKETKYFGDGVNWYSSGDLEGPYLPPSTERISNLAIEETSAKRIPAGALLLGMYDTAALKSGIATEECSCNQAVAFAELDSRLVDPLFVYQTIQIGRPHYRRLQRGIRQKNLNLTLVRQIEIPLPSRRLQDDFVSAAQSIRRQNSKVGEQLLEMDALFNSLQQRAFLGKV